MTGCGDSVGCIAGPQLFLAYEKPLYRTAMNTIIGMCKLTDFSAQSDGTIT